MSAKVLSDTITTLSRETCHLQTATAAAVLVVASHTTLCLLAAVALLAGPSEITCMLPVPTEWQTCCRCDKIQLQTHKRADLAAPQRTCAFPAAIRAAQEHTLPCSNTLT